MTTLFDLCFIFIKFDKFCILNFSFYMLSIKIFNGSVSYPIRLIFKILLLYFSQFCLFFRKKALFACFFIWIAFSRQQILLNQLFRFLWNIVLYFINLILTFLFIGLSLSLIFFLFKFKGSISKRIFRYISSIHTWLIYFIIFKIIFNRSLFFISLVSLYLFFSIYGISKIRIMTLDQLKRNGFYGLPLICF